MMAAVGNLEFLIHQATNIHNEISDTAAVDAFCNELLKETDGPQIAAKLIAHKIQSPLEKEALLSLNVLESCVKQCGQRFHSEIGRFRFLNELIKVVSPKYLGKTRSPDVKSRIIELLYAWTVDLSHETKFKDAYEMLRKQGVIKEDPVYISCYPSTPPPVRSKNPIFDDEEKSRQLQRLLQSRNPEDLQAANRLIKNMVKEDERRMEKVSRRTTELQTVEANVKVLGDMLDNYEKGGTQSDELDVMKDLYESCQKLRPRLFRLAADAEERDQTLGEILKSNDEIGKVMDRYKLLIVDKKKTKIITESDLGYATDLMDLGTTEVDIPASQLLNEQLSALGLNGTSSVISTPPTPSKQASITLDALGDIFGTSATTNPCTAPLIPQSPAKKPTNSINYCGASTEKPSNKYKGLEELDALGESLLKESLPSKMRIPSAFHKQSDKIPLNELQKKSSTITAQPPNTDEDLLGSDCTKEEIKDDVLLDISVNVSEASSSVLTSEQKDTTLLNGQVKEKNLTLADVFVPLENIEPDPSIKPVIVLDHNDVSVTLHFSKNSPRKDVSVIVVSTISTNSSAINNYLFQAVVPKGCKVKLQPSSSNFLPAHNPFLPPPSITQVMHIANHYKHDVSLKFIVSYSIEDEPVTEMGEVERLPVS